MFVVFPLTHKKCVDFCLSKSLLVLSCFVMLFYVAVNLKLSTLIFLLNNSSFGCVELEPQPLC